MNQSEILNAIRQLNRDVLKQEDFSTPEEYEEALQERKRKFNILDKLLFTKNLED